MKNLLIVVLITSFVSVILTSQEKKDAKPLPTRNLSMIGYLVDRNCGKGMVMDDVKKSDAKAARHRKDCSLDETCKAAGFGIVAGGKFYTFDEPGNRKAVDYLTALKKEDNVKVEVTYTMDGDKMKIASIKDYKSKGKKDKSKA